MYFSNFVLDANDANGILLLHLLKVVLGHQSTQKHRSIIAFLTNREYLQRVSQELVHLGDLGGHREVNGPVTNLNNEASKNVRVDLQYVSIIYQ